MNLTIIGPRVAIRPDKLPEQTASGLHIVHDRQQSTMTGTVVALGGGPLTKNGKPLDHFVAVGERVLFSPDSGEELIFEKDVFIVMDEDRILAVVD
jgi:co-chaperonin GroES (HSP10)